MCKIYIIISENLDIAEVQNDERCAAQPPVLPLGFWSVLLEVSWISAGTLGDCLTFRPNNHNLQGTAIQDHLVLQGWIEPGWARGGWGVGKQGNPPIGGGSESEPQTITIDRETFNKLLTRIDKMEQNNILMEQKLLSMEQEKKVKTMRYLD